jgi:DNA-directed RNA polymerase subunit beta'
MGHIELATPVSHIWFLRSMPSRISLILGLTAGDVEKVIYFAGYIITKVHESERAKILKELESEYKNKVKDLKDKKAKDAMKDLLSSTKQDIQNIQQGRVIDEVEYHQYAMKFSTLFEAGIGAEAIFEIFKKLDVAVLIKKLEEDLEKAGAVESDKINRRLSLLKSMQKTGVRPEWMFLTVIPVIPPALRPMVPLDGGRYATSDVNDLYRRVINRNNRLKHLIDLGAPEIILRNEKNHMSFISEKISFSFSVKISVCRTFKFSCIFVFFKFFCSDFSLTGAFSNGNTQQSLILNCLLLFLSQSFSSIC